MDLSGVAVGPQPVSDKICSHWNCTPQDYVQHWANKATSYKKHLDGIKRLGLLAMAHGRRSTPTAGMAILDVMLLDLHAQCAAVQAVVRVRGRNQSGWDGISHGHLRGHLFWGDKILKGMGLKGDRTDKREIKGLFYGMSKAR